MNDPAFIEGINRKNETALKKLYDNYYASLCGYAEKLLNDNGFAEDVVSSCLIKIWDTKVIFPDRKALTAWLYKSVYHAAIDVIREKNSLKQCQDSCPWEGYDEEEAKNMALREEAITYFYKILERLPTQQQQILLYTLQGHKVQEIAVLLHISENTVKMQKKRAYRFVRENFDPDKLSFLLTLLFTKEETLLFN